MIVMIMCLLLQNQNTFLIFGKIIKFNIILFLYIILDKMTTIKDLIDRLFFLIFKRHFFKKSNNFDNYTEIVQNEYDENHEEILFL